MIRLLNAALLLTACSTLCEKHAMADDDKGKDRKITLTVRDKSTELNLTKGDEFELKMEMRAGTGFSWQVAKSDEAVLKLKDKPSIERPDKQKPGGLQLQVFRFRAEAVGVTELELHYRRPFEKDKPPEKTYKITLRVVEKP